jgi:hypothetical protein
VPAREFAGIREIQFQGSSIEFGKASIEVGDPSDAIMRLKMV